MIFDIHTFTFSVRENTTPLAFTIILGFTMIGGIQMANYKDDLIYLVFSVWIGSWCYPQLSDIPYISGIQCVDRELV